MNHKAIETRYAGCRFRSRLEARWAVFFDAMNITWEYEKEGYELRSGRYLPDFWLPNVPTRRYGDGTWVEIKPSNPSPLEQQLLAELCGADEELHEHGVASGIILVGQPGNSGDSHLQIGPWPDNFMVFMQCQKCLCVKFEFMEGSYMICPRCDSPASHESPKIVAALERATSARFEFGEAG
jgi:hypothetical protein